MAPSSDKTAIPRQLHDIHSVSQALGVHWRTIEVLVARGEFPKPLRIGRLRKWHWRTVEDWLNKKAGISDGGQNQDRTATFTAPLDRRPGRPRKTI